MAGIERQRLAAALLGLRHLACLEQAKPGLEKSGGCARRGRGHAGLFGGGARLSRGHRRMMKVAMRASLGDSRFRGKAASA